MTAFDQAWALVKSWGEGFRVHGFDLDAPAVTELVPVSGSNGKPNKWNDGYEREDFNPRFGGHRIHHDLTPGRGSGTGVSGSYYHGGPWDPMWNNSQRQDLTNLRSHLETNKDHEFVHIPKPNNPIATTPKMRDMSMSLLRNVFTETGSDGYGEMVREQGTMNGEPQPPQRWFEQPSTPKAGYNKGTYNSQPALYSLPKTWEDNVDLMASPYTKERGSYWANVDDIVGLKEKDNESVGGDTLRGNRLFDYLGKTPFVRNIMGSDYGDFDDMEYNWMNDPEVLQALSGRMKDTKGLSPMNILLGEYGHDAVVPVLQRDRGATGGHREINQGSVLLPPTTDNWWEDYHPMQSGKYQTLQPHHVQSWLDEYDKTKEITDQTVRGMKINDK